LLRTLDRRQAAWVQPTAESQRAYNDELQRRLARSVWTQGRCHSWYQDPKGQVTTLWPGLLTEYRHVVRAVDEAAFEWRQVR
ncbi:MAG TPA: 4-hydroxyacetophenone monooxygenase, partial [Paraburkholderia sp.]|nr:4-hydroxyacetophenone monooxygenase [Paraburkholderia sp.]